MPVAVVAIWLVQYQRRVVQVASRATSSSSTLSYQTTVCGASEHSVRAVK